MNRLWCVAGLGFVLLSACQKQPVYEPGTVYLEAAQVPHAPEPEVRRVEVPVPTPQLRRLSDVQSEESKPDPQKAIAAAKKVATDGPAPEGFIRAVQVYGYLPGVVYEVYASPGHVTSVALRPGEKLIAKIAGDTSQWQVGDSRAGSGAGARTLLLIKPLRPGVETNLVVTTDQRIYQIDLKSLPGAYHSAVSWHYPADFSDQIASDQSSEAESKASSIAQGVALKKIDFNYRVQAKGSSEPKWMPRRVFTDGRKTYIGFPRDLVTTSAPPLFVLGKKGEAELVNYRVKGDYYIVDQVIDRAELRLGQEPQVIVSIIRTSK